MLVWKNSTSPAATFSTGSPDGEGGGVRSEEHTSELQSLRHLVCRLLLEKKKNIWSETTYICRQGPTCSCRTSSPTWYARRRSGRLPRAARSRHPGAHRSLSTPST